MTKTKKIAFRAVEAISVRIEKKLNETLKSNYTLLFVELIECKGWYYAHCVYMEKNRGMLQVLIVYNIEKGKCFILAPNGTYTTDDICDCIERAKIHNAVNNDIAIEFLDSDIEKFIDLTFLVSKKVPKF
jgi:hypothetical protein